MAVVLVGQRRIVKSTITIDCSTPERRSYTLFCCQGTGAGGREMRQIFPAPKRGQKSNGRGVQLRVPLSSVHRVSPSPLQYIYAVVPDRVAPGERPFPAPPRVAVSAGNAKSGVERSRYPTPPDFSEHNTSALLPMFPPLKKERAMGIIRPWCSHRLLC